MNGSEPTDVTEQPSGDLPAAEAETATNDDPAEHPTADGEQAVEVKEDIGDDANEMGDRLGGVDLGTDVVAESICLDWFQGCAVVDHLGNISNSFQRSNTGFRISVLL